MQWFYAVDGQQLGPVDAAQLTRLRLTGTIGDESLVWREGMADWRPYREAAATAPPVSGPASGGGGVICAECGRPFPLEQVVRLADAFVCAGCKPIRLQKISEGVTDNSATLIRKDHIKHEASIKSVGMLYFLGAVFLGITAIVGLASGGSDGLAAGIVLLCFTAGLIVAGIGIRGLKPWARIVSGVLSGIGLIGFPLGTIINAYILYLLFSRKGATVFSKDYQEVIAATPHIKYRTSIVVWILVGLVVLLVLLGLVGYLASSLMRR